MTSPIILADFGQGSICPSATPLLFSIVYLMWCLSLFLLHTHVF